jgi:hypothetical protein
LTNNIDDCFLEGTIKSLDDTEVKEHSTQELDDYIKHVNAYDIWREYEFMSILLINKLINYFKYSHKAA